MAKDKIIVVGGGIGGLTAGLVLAERGFGVTLLERADQPGGKLRQVAVGGKPIDAGPTVFTMRWVFDRLFNRIGESLDDHLDLISASILARHAWLDGARLDLFADRNQSADAIRDFAGPGEARGYLAFCDETESMFKLLKDPFLCRESADLLGLVKAFGIGGLGAMRKMQPFNTMWRGISRHFTDPRLRQLFGRYATYCGSSPYLAPATLMLVAHVEQDGVWYLKGGMGALASTLSGLIEKRGGIIRCGAHVSEICTDNGRVSGVRLDDGSHIEADAVVMNGDCSALSAGLLGTGVQRAVKKTPRSERSLSALTWMLDTEARGFPLVRHSVFFSSDYQREFRDIFENRAFPTEPTVYVCAQDRGDGDIAPEGERERFLVIVNAPPVGDTETLSEMEIDACENATFTLLERCGLTLDRPPDRTIRTGPKDWNRLFPGTGGAIYGAASHGWQASLQRPGCRTAIPGLYLAGGSIHPGPGVPMAALSGLMAAESLEKDRISIRRSRPAAIAGGTSTR